MDFIELKANTRTATGNGPARVLRREGRIPAILYGPGKTPLMLSVAKRELELALNKGGMRSLLKLNIEDGKSTVRTAMLKELQTDPVKGRYLHADFYEIAMDRKISVSVPVVTTGKSIGIENGGMLQVVRRELEVWCLPNEIPEAIEIDITDLDIGGSVHVEDISLAGDVEIPTEVNFTVLTIVSPMAEKAEEAEEEAEEEEAAEGGEAGEEE